MKSESNSTPVNLAVFLVCVAMITALILPTIVRHRTTARGAACQNNFKKIGLAIHNYHSAYKQLPMACGGTDSNSDATSNKRRLGPVVGLLPFIEHQALWEKIVNPYIHQPSGTKFPPMGPAPWYDANIYRPWSDGPEVYRCPERAGQIAPPKKRQIVYTLEPTEQAMGAGVTTNYVICYGDAVFNAGLAPDPVMKAEQEREARASQRGIFRPGRASKFRDILDGLSNTIMMSETRASVLRTPETQVAKNVEGLRDDPSVCLAAVKDGATDWWEIGRGSKWCDGALPITGFQTILPPNSPSCTSDFGMFDGVLSASSDHPGGVYVLMGDGAVIFITDSIDVGDSSAPAVRIDGVGVSAPGRESPYGLWGALGTRANKETIEERLGQNPPPARGVFLTPRARAKELTSWTDKTGQITLSASFVRIIDKQTIELEDAGGVLHQVPLNTLSDKDIFRAVSMDLTAK